MNRTKHTDRPVKPLTACVADIISESKTGQIILAQVKAREEATIKAREEARERSMKRASMLMELAAEVFHGLNQDWIFKKACDNARFTALGFGNRCDEIAATIKHASYNSRDYLKAFEFLLGYEPKIIPPIVYRNAKQYNWQSVEV